MSFDDCVTNVDSTYISVTVGLSSGVTTLQHDHPVIILNDAAWSALHHQLHSDSLIICHQ